MSTGYQISEQDELHFVTFQIVRWIDIFTRKVYRDIAFRQNSIKGMENTKYGLMKIMQKLFIVILLWTVR